VLTGTGNTVAVLTMTAGALLLEMTTALPLPAGGPPGVPPGTPPGAPPGAPPVAPADPAVTVTVERAMVTVTGGGQLPAPPVRIAFAELEVTGRTVMYLVEVAVLVMVVVGLSFAEVAT